MILVEISASKDVVFTDTDGVAWVSTADVEWVDSSGTRTLYLSLDGQALDHYWDALISSFSSPSYSTEQDYGGYASMNFGQITISPDAFSSEWPPPVQGSIVIKNTETTEDAAVDLFVGDIYLTQFSETDVTYDLNARKYTQKLLRLGIDYNGDHVPYPRAFGKITHVEPLRLADDVSDQPQYHLGGISTTRKSVTISCFTLASAGTKTQVTTTSAHGFSTGNSIIIEGTVNFDETHVIESASGSVFTIDVTYPTDGSEDLPVYAHAMLSGSFAVYDDGVPIQSNVTVNVGGTFSLIASPVGTVTISGTSVYTTLLEVVTWCQGELSGVDSVGSTYSRGTSPDVSFWADSQMPIIDFMSDICAFFTHYFYIKSNILYLGDMLLDNGSTTLDEYGYFTASYSVNDAISQIVAKWVTHKAVEERVVGGGSAVYVKDIENAVAESLYTIDSGTTTGTDPNYLVDSGAAFIGIGVLVGQVVMNTTDDTSSVIISVSGTRLEIEDDIFVSGDDYRIGPSFPYGQDLDLTPYHDIKNNVSAALQNILSVMSKNTADITIPVSSSLPDPGTKITFTDTRMVSGVSTYIRARTISYDFENYQVIITGEGVIT